MALSDYPEADVEAHRWTAKLLTVFAVLFFFGGGILLVWTETYSSPPGVMGVFGVGLGAIMYAAANAMRIEALRWEVNGIHHGETAETSEGGTE